MKTIRNMRTNWPALILLGVLIGVVVGRTDGVRPAPTQPAVIATVNLDVIFDRLDEFASARDELKQEQDRLQQEMERRQAEIQSLEADLELFQPGSDQAARTSEQIAELSYNLQAFTEFATRKLDVEKADALEIIYERLRVVAGDLAQENGYDIIFVDDSIAKAPTAITEAEMMKQISARRMLYAGRVIDVSDALIARMNN